jgi:UrcA family protein
MDMRTFGFSLARSFALAAACLAASPVLAADAKLVLRDLDLASDAGRAELDRRIEAAAQQVCAPEAVTGSRIAARKPSRSCLAEARDVMTAQIAEKTERNRLAADHGHATAGLRR